MCKLVDKITLDYVHVYKVAVLEDGKYYSPTTGVEYAMDSEIKVPEVQKNYVPYDIVNDLLDKNSYSYIENMVGRTCGFIEKSAATDFLDRFKITYPEVKFVLLKMLLKKDLMLGIYGDDLVIGGKSIITFREGR